MQGVLGQHARPARGGADAVVGQIQVQVDPVPGDEFVIVLGLGQFLTTFVITMVYVRFANRRLDPISTSIRADLESQQRPNEPEGV